MSRVVGLMSGTSLDGVDAALVEFSDSSFQTVATWWLPYPDDIRRDVLALHTTGQDELARAAVLANRLAHCYARAVLDLLAEASVDPATVEAIGCHGQTVRHQPASGYSLQLNNPSLLAELTGIPVVADFRSRDIAAGGQGAPLVPAFHAFAFGNPQEHRAVLNLGGIANLTDLPPGGPVRGFDSGPGNMLLDAWIERHQGVAYDGDGAWAANGRVQPALLERLLAEPYFAAAPPKSCGREEFGLAWLEAQLSTNVEPVDVQATVLELTARSAIDAMHRWCGHPTALYVCGGGAQNLLLMQRLAELATPCRVAATDDLGLPADWVEAVAFAWLAKQTLKEQPGNLPSVTGAKGPRVLGAIYPR